MSETLYAALDVDESAGIDPAEVTKIKFTLERIKLLAADFAKRNDAEDTIQILDLWVKLMKAMSDKGPQEMMKGLSQSMTPAGGNHAIASAPSNSEAASDELERAKAQNESLASDRKVLKQVLSFFGITVPADDNTAVDPNVVDSVKKSVTDKESAAKAAATPNDVVDKAKLAKALEALPKVELKPARFGGSPTTDEIDKYTRGIKAIRVMAGLKEDPS